MTATHRRARKHAPHPSGRAGLPGRATSHPIARVHRPSWLALDSLACTGPCSIHDPRSRRPPPSATPSPTPTRRSSRQILASAPPGDTAATHSRLLSPTNTQTTLHGTPRPTRDTREAILDQTTRTRPPAAPAPPALPPSTAARRPDSRLPSHARIILAPRTAQRDAPPSDPRNPNRLPPRHHASRVHRSLPPCHPHQSMLRAARTPTATPSRAHLLRRTQTRPHSPLPRRLGPLPRAVPTPPPPANASWRRRPLAPILRPRHSGNGGAARRTGHCVVCENSRRALEGLFSAPYTRKQNGVRTRAPGPPLRPTPADTANRTRTRALRPCFPPSLLRRPPAADLLQQLGFRIKGGLQEDAATYLPVTCCSDDPSNMHMCMHMSGYRAGLRSEATQAANED